MEIGEEIIGTEGVLDRPAAVPPNARLTQYVLRDDRNNLLPGFCVGTMGLRRANAMTALLVACDFAHAFVNRHRDALADMNIVVVGAGVTGVAVAHILSSSGAKVVVYEKEGEPLFRWREAVHRYIHPGFCEWPKSGWNSVSSDRIYANYSVEDPKIDWQADTADKVKGKISAYVLQPEFRDKLLFRPHNEVTECVPNGDRNQVRVSTTGSTRPEACDFVVYCPGLGDEKPAGSSVSYWYPDTNRSSELVIAGGGDGAAIDTIKHLVRASDEHWMKDLLDVWAGTEEHDIVREFVASDVLQNGSMATEAHWRRFEDGLGQRLKDLPRIIGARLELDRKVSIVHRHDTFYGGHLTPINMVLMMALRKQYPNCISFVQNAHYEVGSHGFVKEGGGEASGRLRRINDELRGGSVGFRFRGGTEQMPINFDGLNSADPLPRRKDPSERPSVPTNPQEASR